MLNNNFSWLAFLNLFLAGVLLGLPLIYTKRIWFSIALHFSWNFTQGTIYGFNVSGNEIYSVIKQSMISNNFWNGGSFGIEGSILSVALLIFAVLGILWFYQRLQKT